MLLKYNNITIL